MNNMRFINPNPKKKSNNKGFYTAFGICLLAIAVAAIMTYSDVYNVFSPSKPEDSSTDLNSSDITINSEELTNETQAKPYSSEPAVSEIVALENEITKSANTVPETQTESEEQTENEEPQTNQSTAPNIYPSSKNVIKEYSNENPVYSVTLNDWRVHDGTDFAAEKGSIVRSITDGTVKEIYNDQALGTTMVIDHGDFEAYYCGLGDTTLVNPGDSVAMAQDIGSIKSVPCELLEQDHLHLAIKKDNAFVNPMTILQLEDSAEDDNIIDE